MRFATGQLQDAYRSEARRVRARLRHRPREMYEALKELAERSDRWAVDRPQRPVHSPRPATRAIPVSEQPTAHAESGNSLGETLFEQIVRQQVTGPVLRYSVRQALLKQAAALGVERFPANLIIARVQYARRHLVDPAPPPPDRGILMPLLAVLGLEALALAVAWWLLQ